MALIFLAKDIDTVSEAWRDIKRLLREKHKLWENDVDDFNIYESKGMIQAVNVITKALSFLIIWVAWIILIVSWIGIMNVMFAGVAEKTKDIWISRAIGAKKKDILLQFLLESIILTLFWGLIWVFLAESLIMTVNIFSDVQLIRSNGWDIFALSFALVIWVFFGIYPAKKATKLDVVESLK
jgi:putative ABC transport system permease protein